MSDVKFDGVSFRYPTGPADVLRDLSFAPRAGEITWLFGPLGAGCTTVLLIAAGLAPRHTGGSIGGSVSVLGHDPQATETALAGQIGFVTATPQLQLSGIAGTVWEEVAFTPANLGWPIERIRPAVDRALEELAVEHLSRRKPGTLSGGELQRVVIASMSVLTPKVWLLDEPATALDASGRALAYQLFRMQADHGATVLVASEDVEALALVADRLVVLRDGHPVLDGPPKTLLAGDAIWDEGPGSTAVAALAREAGRMVESSRFAAPYPITVEEGVARWR
ncbi:MAG: ABC transporter ATP-binding protein [Gemmatimonadales bacterium]|nr:ABC transporter ATP-binding protein [Gemmatimonadales bacterium]